MAIQVRYLSEEEIEREADLLLAEYEETTGEPVKLPIPVAEIATHHLALQLGFADLHETLGIPMLREGPDVLGAIFIEEETILIDQSLNSKRNPLMQARYSFSVGHEIGHWQLHRSYVNSYTDQAPNLDQSSESRVICRSSEAKEPIEWQADYFSSCLLMPKPFVCEFWKRRFPGLEPLVRGNMKIKPLAGSGPRSIGNAFQNTEYDNFADGWAQFFAPYFGVSRQAMRIRLEKLELLLRRSPRKRSLAAVP